MPRLGNSPDSYLQLHDGTWRVSVGVPKDLRPILGRSHLSKSLGTSSIEVARVLRTEPLAEFKRTIAAAAGTLGGRYGRRLAREAEAMARARRSIADSDPSSRAAFEEVVKLRIGELADGADRHTGTVAETRSIADAYMRVAVEGDLPISRFHSDFMAQIKVSDRSAMDDARALRMILDWCASTDTPALIGSIDNRAVHGVLDLTMAGMSANTVTKYLGRMAVYWEYLIERGAASHNPFRRVSLSLLDLTPPSQLPPVYQCRGPAADDGLR